MDIKELRKRAREGELSTPRVVWGSRTIVKDFKMEVPAGESFIKTDDATLETLRKMGKVRTVGRGILRTDKAMMIDGKLMPPGTYDISRSTELAVVAPKPVEHIKVTAKMGDKTLGEVVKAIADDSVSVTKFSEMLKEATKKAK